MSESRIPPRVLAGVLAALTAAAGPATGPAAGPSTRPSTRPATAVPTVKAGRDGPSFLRQHAAFLAEGKDHPIGLLFLGDSITNGWFWGHDRDIYTATFGQYHPANFGIGGDRTEHVLWRIANGELDAPRPKVVVLLIGTNDIGAPAGDILAGVTAVADAVHAKLPRAELLLLGIFPRGRDPKAPDVARMRDKIRAVNAGLAQLDDGRRTRFLDLGRQFLMPDGSIAPEVMRDALHPTLAGYAIFADAIGPQVGRMMGD